MGTEPQDRTVAPIPNRAPMRPFVGELTVARMKDLTRWSRYYRMSITRLVSEIVDAWLAGRTP